MTETSSSEPPVTEVFMLLADLGMENGAKNIKDLPGCYELSIGKAFIAINGHTEKKIAKVPGGAEIGVEPCGAVMFWNGWPIYMGNPAGGCVLMMTEDELIEKIKSLFKRGRIPDDLSVQEFPV